MPEEIDGDAGDMVAVGRVGPVRGLRGEVFLEPWTDAPEERFAPGQVLRTGSGVLVVAASSVQGGKQVVRFEGVEDRAGAEALRGTVVSVAARERPPLDDPDEFYDTDLVGLAVRTVAGEELGPVTGVLHAAGASYLELGERLVPFVAAIVPTVDVTGGFVVIDPPEGLFGV